MDPERFIRKRLAKKLGRHFTVREEVELLSKADKSVVRSDLLINVSEGAHDFLVAIEIKSKVAAQAKNYRDAFLQAYRYIGRKEKIDDSFPIVEFALIYQERSVGSPLLSERQEQFDACYGVELAFNPFNVGRLIEEQKERLAFRFGNENIWRSKASWSRVGRNRFFGGTFG